MDVVSLVIALVLAALTYVVAALFLPYAVAVLLAVLVFLLAAFGRGRVI